MMATRTVACLEQLRDPALGQLRDPSGSAYRVTRTKDHTPLATWCCENKKMKSGISVKVGCESKASCDQYLTHIPVFLILRQRRGRCAAAAASTAVAATRTR